MTNSNILERLCALAGIFAILACLLLIQGCATMIPTPNHTKSFHVPDATPIAFQRAMQTAAKLNDGMIQHDANSGVLRITNITGSSLSVIIQPDGTGSRLEITGKPSVYTPWADGGIQRFIDAYHGANL